VNYAKKQEVEKWLARLATVILRDLSQDCLDTSLQNSRAQHDYIFTELQILPASRLWL